MAVRIDFDLLLESAASEVCAEAESLLAADQVQGPFPDYGGAQGIVVVGHVVFDVWVGVADAQLVVECDCGGYQGADVCEHGLAVALAAEEAGFSWSGGAVPPSMRPPDRAVQRFADAVDRLSRRQLHELVAGQAVRDRTFAAELLNAAGMLDGPDLRAIAELRGVIRDVAGIRDGHRRWGFDELLRGGERLVAELSVFAAGPVTEDVLLCAEEALRVWHGYLAWFQESWERFDPDPEMIGRAIVDVHVLLAAELSPDPVELAGRLAAIAAACEVEPCFDLGDYRDILGADGVAAYEGALAGRRPR